MTVRVLGLRLRRGGEEDGERGGEQRTQHRSPSRNTHCPPNGCTAGELRVPASWAETPTDSLSRVNVKLPDGSELELRDGRSGDDAVAAIGSGLARAALAIKVDGELRDLSAPLAGGETIEIV